MSERRERSYVATPSGEVAVVRLALRCLTKDRDFAVTASRLVWHRDGASVAASVYCGGCQQRHTLRWPDALEREEEP